MKRNQGVKKCWLLTDLWVSKLLIRLFPAIWRGPSQEWAGVLWWCSRSPHTHCNTFCVSWRADLPPAQILAFLIISLTCSPLALVQGKRPIWHFYSSYFFWSILAFSAIIAKRWWIAKSATGTGAKPAKKLLAGVINDWGL